VVVSDSVMMSGSRNIVPSNGGVAFAKGMAKVVAQRIINAIRAKGIIE